MFDVELAKQGKSQLRHSQGFHHWVSLQLIAAWENGIRKILNAPVDAKLTYYYERCLTVNGKCVHNHKRVWCGGKTVIQFIHKVYKDELACALHVTIAPNKSAIYEECDLLEAENMWDETPVNSYWIGDCKMGTGENCWMICCDDVWQWLWMHTLKRTNS